MQKQHPYQPTPELIAARDAVEAARAKCQKLRTQVDETAALIPIIQADVQRIQAELGAEEGGLALCEDKAESKRHEKAIERLSTELVDKERDLRRANAKVEALENMAPDLDDQVAAKLGEMQSEKSIWIQNVKEALSDELAEAAKSVQAVMAKAKAIEGSFAQRELSDFVSAAWLPDPVSFYRTIGGHNVGPNLLQHFTDADKAIGAAIASELAPLFRVMNIHHSPYVPLAKRPKPYVRKGYSIQGQDYFDDKRDADDAPLAKAPAVQPQELNMGPAMVENFGKPAPQVQQ